MKALVNILYILLNISQNGKVIAGKDELDSEFRDHDFYGCSQLPEKSDHLKMTCRDNAHSKFNPDFKIESGKEIKRTTRTTLKFKNVKGEHINQAEKKVLRALRHDFGHLFNYLKNSEVDKDCNKTIGKTDPNWVDKDGNKEPYKGPPYRGRRHQPYHASYNHELKRCYPLPILEDAFFLSAVNKDLNYLKQFFDNNLLRRISEIAEEMVDYILQNDKMFEDRPDFRGENYKQDAIDAEKGLEGKLQISSHTDKIVDNPDEQNINNEVREKRHADIKHDEVSHKEKEDSLTSRTTIEMLKDAISCRLDFLWAHFLGLTFTGNDCTFCHDEAEDGKIVKCPIRDNDNAETKYLNRHLDIDAALLCEQPGRCADMRNLFNL